MSPRRQSRGVSRRVCARRRRCMLGPRGAILMGGPGSRRHTAGPADDLNPSPAGDTRLRARSPDATSTRRRFHAGGTLSARDRPRGETPPRDAASPVGGAGVRPLGPRRVRTGRSPSRPGLRSGIRRYRAGGPRRRRGTRARGRRVGAIHWGARPGSRPTGAGPAHGARGAGRNAATGTRLPRRRLRALAVLLSAGPRAGHRPRGVGAAAGRPVRGLGTT